MLKIEFSRLADKFIASRSPKHNKQIAKKIISLLQSPPSPTCKILKGTKDPVYYRAKVGEYRVIYRFDEKTLFIESIGKRNDGEVYKKFFQ